jgi:hypothetical protein
MPETKSVILQLEAEPPEHCLAHLIIHLRFLISIKNADFVEDHLTNFNFKPSFILNGFIVTEKYIFMVPCSAILNFPLTQKIMHFVKNHHRIIHPL